MDTIFERSCCVFSMFMPPLIDIL